ncbi:MAG: alpha/beta hydrolase family protein [Xenococcaceae cyanobacterium]
MKLEQNNFSVVDRDELTGIDSSSSLVGGDNISLTSDPLYNRVDRYTTTISATGDPADIYYPVVSNAIDKDLEFPIALMLQGALVDKADYSNFATQVASYGFVVVVPNRERTAIGPRGLTATGFFAEQDQVNDILEQMVVEDNNPASPAVKIVDTEKLGLLGHSFGGYVGLASIQDICVPGVCSGDFNRPPELMAGIFYGTNFRNPPEAGEFVPIDNQNIPTGLIAGSLDGVSDFGEVEATYNQIQDSPKTLITVEGANHYGITNQDNLVRDTNRPTLDQTTATETIARWSGLFLRAHLQGDTGALDYIYNTGDALDPNASAIGQLQLMPESVFL